MTRVLVEVVCIESIVATGRSRSIFLADGPGISGMRCASVLMGVVSLDSVLVGTAVCSYMSKAASVLLFMHSLLVIQETYIFRFLNFLFSFFSTPFYQYQVLRPNNQRLQYCSVHIYCTVPAYINETIQNNYKNNEQVKVLCFLSFFNNVHVRSDELK